MALRSSEGRIMEVLAWICRECGNGMIAPLPKFYPDVLPMCDHCVVVSLLELVEPFEVDSVFFKNPTAVDQFNRDALRLFDPV